VSDFLIFLVVIGSLILGHELGHFVSGKLLGVKVEEFGIGFPPRMLTLFYAGGTRFSLNWLPFGGFNRFAGEDDRDVEGGLASSSKTVRTIVLLSGSLTNIAIALIAFTIAFRFAAPDTEKVSIAGVDPGTPAEAANILPGDLVLTVDEKPITGFETMASAISSKLGEEIEISLQRGDEIVVVSLVPRTEYPEGKGPIGVSLRNPTKEVGWGEAFTIGVESAYIQFRELVLLPGRLLQGEVAPEDARISGLKGMYDMLAWAGDIDRSSERPFLTLNLVGIISLGLAIANLLPFPALDGGRLMFILLEVIIGRRIDQRYEGFAHTIGFFLLLAVLIYVNFLDFIKPIPLP
jgi:regulator of sigma E protease